MNLVKETARERLEDAIYRALEAGLTEKEITEEVEYTLKNYEDES
jgi:N-acetylglucosamine kinase-like BadF-type ATPase